MREYLYTSSAEKKKKRKRKSKQHCQKRKKKSKQPKKKIKKLRKLIKQTNDNMIQTIESAAARDNMLQAIESADTIDDDLVTDTIDDDMVTDNMNNYFFDDWSQSESLYEYDDDSCMQNPPERLADTFFNDENVNVMNSVEEVYDSSSNWEAEPENQSDNEEDNDSSSNWEAEPENQSDNEEDNDSSSNWEAEPENQSDNNTENYIDYHINEEDINHQNNTSSVDMINLKKCNYATYFDTAFFKEYRKYYVQKYTETRSYEIRRIVELNIWSYHQQHMQILPTTAIEEWVYNLFTKHVYFIKLYTEKVMLATQNIAHTTVKLWLTISLNPFWVWFTSYRDHCTTNFPINMTHNMHFNHVVKDIRNDLNKVIKRTRLTKKNVAYLVEHCKIPEGDSIKVINDVITKKYHYFKKIKHADIDNKIYSQFCKMLYASMYAGPMGRVKVFDNLLVSDIPTLTDKSKYYETTDFKSASSIGIQPVYFFQSITRFTYYIIQFQLL
jgi:hypothetical protein